MSVRYFWNTSVLIMHNVSTDWHHNPYVRLWLKSTPCKSNDGRFVTRMKTLLRTTLIYKRATQLPCMPVITQPFFWGTMQWRRSDHRRCWLADNSWWLWVVFRVGSKQKILITFIFRPWTDQGLFLYLWMRQHFAWRLSLSIVSTNCKWLYKDLVFLLQW